MLSALAASYALPKFPTPAYPPPPPSPPPPSTPSAAAASPSLCFLSSCKIYDVTFSCSATLFHEALGLRTKSRVVGRAGLCAFCLLFTPHFLRLLFFLILLLLPCLWLCLPWCSLCIEMLRDKSVISPRRSWLI